MNEASEEETKQLAMCEAVKKIISIELQNELQAIRSDVVSGITARICRKVQAALIKAEK